MLLVIAAASFGQTPEGFFRSGGASFRDNAPETRLYWNSHIENSCRRILRAADLAGGKGVVTVLGAGVAAEIPLAELARRFGRVILVDLDGPSMLQSLDQVPLGLRYKVELRVMDITSFASSLMERLDDSVNSSSSSIEAFRRMDAIFGELRLEDPANLPPSDLVISSLVLSEIPRFPFGYADKLMRARFHTPLKTWNGNDKAFEKLVLLAIQDHVRLLGSLSRNGGTIYYSDTIARGPAYTRFSAEMRVAVESNVLADFRRLGLAASVGEVRGAIDRLCEADHPVKTEVEAYERLLAAYRQASGDTFEPLLPVGELQKQCGRHGLVLEGAPESWWWLAYPCAISQSPGAFQVTSWILRRGPSAQ